VDARIGPARARELDGVAQVALERGGDGPTDRRDAPLEGEAVEPRTVVGHE
jgi:hypothetical protein